MKIAVLDFGNNCVDIIDADDKELAKYSNELDFLIEHCNYNPDNIKWIAGDNVTFNLNLTDKSFR